MRDVKVGFSVLDQDPLDSHGDLPESPPACLPSLPCPFPQSLTASSREHRASLKMPCTWTLISEALELLTDLAFLPQQHLNENLAKLTAKFEKATTDKLKCQQEAEATAGTISLANRLVSVNLQGRGGGRRGI